ncbi:unnamed protein product [Penicillium olsonii]|nr:unnamed protein product [Penicillium olsonii]
MQKRAAFGDQGSKDGDGGFGQGTPDDKPHRATAAQLASRKIKDVRRRRAPTPTTGGGSDTPSFNPFAGTAAPAANPAPPSTGFTFGQTQNQSQSFPGASSGAGQGGMFSSGTNGQAGGQPSFNFGGSSTSFGAQPASNPFSINTSFGGNTQPATNGFSFGGFNAGGSGNQATPTPAPAPAPTFGGFGAQQNTSTPGSGLFGQSTSHITSPGDESMQTSPDTKPKADSGLGTKPAIGGSPLANPFSTLSGQTASNPFAPKPAATSETPKPAFKPLFGAAAESKPEEAKAQPAASNLFAPKPASDAPASNPFASLSGQTAGASNLFAPKPSAEQTPAKPAEAAKPFGSLFGSTTTPKPAEPASNLFAPASATDTPKASNPFASLSTPKVPETEGAAKATEAQPFSFSFGTPALSKTPDAESSSSATPAFGNMFATPKPAGEDTNSKPAADPQPFKSLFGTPAPSKSTESKQDQSATPAFGNMFATPKPATENAAPKPAEAQSFKPLFGASATPKPAETKEEKTSEPAKPQSSGSLFGASPAPAKSGEEGPAPTPSNPFASLSGQSSFSSPFGSKATEQTTPAQPTASLFGASTSSKSEKEPAPAVQNNSSTFQNPFSGVPQNTGKSTDATHAPPSAPTELKSCLRPSSSSSSSSSSTPPPSSTPAVYPYEVSNTLTAQKADGLFPNSTTDQTKMSIDNGADSAQDPKTVYMKIAMLTAAFKAHVAECDPYTDDIDESIIMYAELRRELGVPIGAIAPEEEEARAGLDMSDADEAGSANEATGHAQAAPPSFDSPAPAAKSFSGASDTVNKFKQSFSAPGGPASPAPIGSSTPASTPAAPLSFTPAGAPPTKAVPTPAATAAESSGSTPAAPAFAIPKFGGASATPISSAPAPAFTAPKLGGSSATPISSAPAPAFSIPQFGGGSASGTDMMAQFKINAEKSAAEEKAKRKAEDFDSEDDDEEEWERKYAEEQRAKRAKHEQAAANRPVFVPGQGFKFGNAETASATTESATETSVSVGASTSSSFPPPSKSLFGASTTSSSFGGFSAPPASAPLADAKPSAASTSLFSTSSAPSSTSAVFGTSQPIPSSQNIFGGLKPSQPKRKSSVDASDDEAESSPRKKQASPPASTGGLFGRVSNPTTPSLTPPATNPFGAPPVAEAPKAPSAQTAPATSPFGASLGSGTPKSAPVEATSAPSAPSASTAAGAEDGEGEPGEIFDLAKGNVGEEDETVVHEQRSRTFKLDKGSWVPQGVGILRLLKHPETGRSRMVIRGDPSGNVILNTLLKKELDYNLGSLSIQLMVPGEDGVVTQYAVRVKKEHLQGLFDKIQGIRY